MRVISTLLQFLLLVVSVLAAFKPDIKSTFSDHISKGLFYFDDSPVVINLNNRQLLVSENDGKDWISKLENIDTIHIDKINKQRAFAFTESNVQYVTTDRGKNWNQFETAGYNSVIYDINVNSKNPDLVLIAFVECEGQYCTNDVYYTKDGFKTNPKLLHEKVTFCSFTKSNNVFDEGHDDRILCLRTERDNHGYVKRSEIIASDDFFDKDITIIDDSTGTLATSYVLELSIIQSFIVATVQSDKYDQYGSSVFLFVSKDGLTFQKAIIEGNLIAKAFSFLPSTKSSLHVSAWSSSDGSNVGNILVSDSEGFQFRNLLSSIEGNSLGFLNLEKVETIEGVWTANVLEGYNGEFHPKSRTKITLDDGRTWDYLKVDECEGKDDCSLNILSLEERRGDGQGATGATPGILVGIGNSGSSLDQEVLNLKTYISRDGGLSWKKAIDEPTIFAFGDLGNVIVAAPYHRNQTESRSKLLTNKIYYSLDQGKTWETTELEKEFIPYLLTTTIDGTSSKFILIGLYRENSAPKQVIFALDFAKAFEKICDDNDLETWYGRTGIDGKGTCIFGHKDAYKRRKQDSKCFINKVFEDLKIEETPCICADVDFECSFGFTLNSRGECVTDRKILKQMCAETTQTELKLKTQRRIPGNLCDGGDYQIAEQSISCEELKGGSNKIETTETLFEGNIVSYIFLDTTETSNLDETLIAKTSRNKIFISHNGGQKFEQYVTDDEIVQIYLNPYSKDDVYLLTTNNRIHYSYDRANTFKIIKTPSETNLFGLPLLTFNKASHKSFIFYGNQNCESEFSQACVPAAYITRDAGKSWKLLQADVRTCDFVGSRYTEYLTDKNLIYCQVNNADNSFSLVSSTDYFSTSKVEFKRIVGFATTTHFTVVASIDEEEGSLKAYVTVDGTTFAEALFPKDFVVSQQQAYTILGSETGAIFLHVTNNDRPGSEFGVILKSNGNGTSYVLSERYVNRNEFGFVDYERVEGLEGIAIINTVKNFEEARKGSLKQLQSKITFNDGSEWDYVQPPSTDSEGKKYECIGSSLDKCSLHLHGYTERKDYRDTFSSGSATGLLLGVGNVGDSLTAFKEGSTFLTSDGGSTWKEVKKGVYQWEFGDRGSIIVLVDSVSSTNLIHYSLDEGYTWNDYQFSEDTVKVDDIATVPKDSSKRFLLVTRSESGRGDESRTFAIDFENVFDRQCVLDFEHPDQDDFEYWTPKHPFTSSECLFGHEAKYLRKLSDRTNCFVGSAPLGELFKIVRNCACTRHDYECDYNYVKSSDGTCKLVDGLEPEDHSQVCSIDSNAIEYFEPTGYRKIPLSTCEGGQEFDKVTPIPCPGKEGQFENKHGGKLRGFGLALVIVIPIAVFISALWFVYEKGIRRNGGFARFGEIRLGDENDLIENNQTDRAVNAVVRGGITVVAVVIATFKMIKILDAALINKVKALFNRPNRYTSIGETYSTLGNNDYRDQDTDSLLGEVIDDEDYEIGDDEDDRGSFHDNEEAGDIDA